MNEQQPRSAAANAQADTLLLTCIDYRLPSKIVRYMESRGLGGNYDHVILAGAALGAVTPLYPQWGRSFRDHLELAIELHDIRRVMILDHRDCGGYRLILGRDLTGEAEEAAHRVELRRLAQELRAAHPKLAIETLLMNLDGSVEAIV